MAKRKKPFLMTSTGAKAMEAAGIVVIIILFAVLVLLNRAKFSGQKSNAVQAAEPVSSGVQPYAIANAFQNAGFAVKSGVPDLSDESGWSYLSRTDSDGVASIDLTVPLYADQKEDGTATVSMFNTQNEAVRKRLLSLLTELLPVFGENPSVASGILQKCTEALGSEKIKTVSLGYYTLQLVPVSEGLSLSFSRPNSQK